MEPFAIHVVEVAAGHVALSPLPGRAGEYARDLDIIRRWRPDLVISMTTSSEMEQAGAGKLGDDLHAEGITWTHLPIEDFGAPSPDTEAAWPRISQSAAQILARGGRVLVHCRGGCGRSGMIALRLMVEQGIASDAALRRLRAVRPCAVETDGQMRWATCAPD